ncbi:hypothetical protein QMK19_32945 [Streptomyces sp. H10-C2]|uniref:hypothetical protein n=1 Tax=unclassified Streptomyces TaxID=2593676 RepID=UPI0024B96A0C|nr:MULTISPECIES: hypothetical protein [unclassified Streptomyces]MDJ0345422.1 hypothetical protein [Streptomyces sp. PH10-H1]MDJ0374314.1 hypothetical protein [Streptomyces sp. H10-C2]
MRRGGGRFSAGREAHGLVELDQRAVGVAAHRVQAQRPRLLLPRPSRLAEVCPGVAAVEPELRLAVPERAADAVARVEPV